MSQIHCWESCVVSAVYPAFEIDSLGHNPISTQTPDPHLKIMLVSGLRITSVIFSPPRFRRINLVRIILQLTTHYSQINECQAPLQTPAE